MTYAKILNYFLKKDYELESLGVLKKNGKTIRLTADTISIQIKNRRTAYPLDIIKINPNGKLYYTDGKSFTYLGV